MEGEGALGSRHWDPKRPAAKLGGLRGCREQRGHRSPSAAPGNGASHSAHRLDFCLCLRGLSDMVGIWDQRGLGGQGDPEKGGANWWGLPAGPGLNGLLGRANGLLGAGHPKPPRGRAWLIARRSLNAARLATLELGSSRSWEMEVQVWGCNSEAPR